MEWTGRRVTELIRARLLKGNILQIGTLQRWVVVEG